MIKIRIGTESDKRKLKETYPICKNVIGENGYLLLAENENETVGFLWAFKRKIPAPVEQEELFINVIDVIHTDLRRKGLGSEMVQEIIRIARQEKVYQVRAYCDSRNVSSHRLWIKNNFSISPCKLVDGTIPGSFVSYVL